MNLDWRTRAKHLAGALADAGALTDPRWAEAIRTTPRQVFVPEYFAQTPDLTGWELVTSRSDPDRWAAEVWEDRSLVTELRSSPDVLGGHPIPTSSSTMPSLMVRMLDMLDVTSDDHVLEIGTGTGYNAALLSAALGDDRITSVELQPALAAAARDRLAEAGRQPTVIATDGTGGAPDRAPYDRVIATCGVSRVPAAWIGQLAVGGRLVADLRTEASSSLTVLTKTDDEHLAGHLTGRPGLFMWLRPEVEHPMLDPDRAAPGRDGDRTVRDTAIDPDELATPGLRTLIGIACPDLDIPQWAGHPITSGDGSWAKVVGSTVTQGGPRRVWDRIESLTAVWQRLGFPDTDRFGVTVAASGKHRFWLDHPTAALPQEAQAVAET